MTLDVFLNTVSLKGARLWSEGEKIRYSGPRGALSQEDKDYIILHRQELLTRLGMGGVPHPYPSVLIETPQHPPSDPPAERAQDLIAKGPTSGCAEALEVSHTGAVKKIAVADDCDTLALPAHGGIPNSIPSAPAAPAGADTASRFSAVPAQLAGSYPQDQRLLAIADLLIEETDGKRPPPNPSVHVMLDEARERFSRFPRTDTLSGWIKRNDPLLNAQWPDAPLDASWLDWRGKIGEEHVAALDLAFAGITAERAAEASVAGRQKSPKEVKNVKGPSPSKRSREATSGEGTHIYQKEIP